LYINNEKYFLKRRPHCQRADEWAIWYNEALETIQTKQSFRERKKERNKDKFYSVRVVGWLDLLQWRAYNIGR
jgi:hypothetical protein